MCLVDMDLCGNTGLSVSVRTECTSRGEVGPRPWNRLGVVGSPP
jgi:hypothetical protein